MQFIMENLATILVSLVIAAIVAVVIVKQVSDKRKGKSSCGCGCSGCPSASVCHETKNHE